MILLHFCLHYYTKFYPRDSDPDKSDTPLLHDSLHSPDKDNTTSGWLKSAR